MDKKIFPIKIYHIPAALLSIQDGLRHTFDTPKLLMNYS